MWITKIGQEVTIKKQLDSSKEGKIALGSSKCNFSWVKLEEWGIRLYEAAIW